MKFGMFYPVAVASEADLGKGLWGLDRARYDTAIQELREQAICADETGWTSMMFAEHHFEIEGYHVTPNPLMLNVYLAQHTKRLRQGQMGLVLPNWTRAASHWVRAEAGSGDGSSSSARRPSAST